MLFEKVLKSRAASLRNSELSCPNEVVSIVVILYELVKGTTSSKVRASKAPFPRLELGACPLGQASGPILREHRICLWSLVVRKRQT